MHAIPGDPFLQEQAIPEEILRTIYRHYGLDQPLYVQYWQYLEGIFSGNLGPSFTHEGMTVNQIIANSFLPSFSLGLFAFVISISCGITVGLLSAWYQNRWIERGLAILILIGTSVPGFLLATLLQYIFSIQLQLFPVARWGSFSHMVLPAVAIAALPTAFIARLTRANVIEVLQQDYILTAISKGISSTRLILNHVTRNAILPVITYTGPLIANILTGSFVVEKIFAIPGLGYWFVTSISNRDYTVILGLTLFYSFILLTCVFFVDLVYVCVDPRIVLRRRSYG
jgi:oligopeptide transport system permease protein